MEVIKSSFTKIAEGLTGAQVADIINGGFGFLYGAEQYDITQSDVIDYAVEYEHLKNTVKISPKLYDNDWVEQPTSGIFKLIGPNKWRLACDNAIKGTIHLIVTYMP